MHLRPRMTVLAGIFVPLGSFNPRNFWNDLVRILSTNGQRTVSHLGPTKTFQCRAGTDLGGLSWIEVESAAGPLGGWIRMDGMGVCVMTNGNRVRNLSNWWKPSMAMRGRGTIGYASSIIEWTPTDRDKSCWEPTFGTNWPHDKRISPTSQFQLLPKKKQNLSTAV